MDSQNASKMITNISALSQFTSNIPFNKYGPIEKKAPSSNKIIK